MHSRVKRQNKPRCHAFAVKMRASTSLVAVLAISSAAVLLAPRAADAKRMVIHDEDIVPPSFALDGVALGSPRAPTGADFRAPASLAGGTIATLSDGAVVIDPDSGDFVRLDRKGELVARVPIGPEAAQVVVDRAARVAF